jgi:signal transduction histidine kinase
MQRGPVRAGILLALAIVALAQVFDLLQGVRSVRRLQARVRADAEQRVGDLRARLDPVVTRGGRAAWDEAASLAIAAGVAAEVEVLDASGRTVYVRPAPAPVAYRLRPDQRQAISSGGSVTVAVQEGTVVRTLSYLPLPAEPGLVLRLAAPAADLQDEVHERRQVFLAQLTSLVVLALAFLLVARGAAPVPAAARAGALDVYEQAMERLRDHGEQVEARHEVERRRLSDALHEQEAMARAGELTAGIVHEVRNGLGTILGYARLIERAGLGDDDASAARSIREECETLETVVRRFADFVKLERLRPAPVDLARLVSRVAGRERRGHERVDVRLETQGELPAAQADEELLERAVENVLRNAVAAASEGGGHVRVSVERVAGGALEIRVEDDGPGLAPGHTGEIRPFQSTKPGGLGLGLPLARKIMRLHGGDLALAPASPGGVAVTLSLPEVSRA